MENLRLEVNGQVVTGVNLLDYDHNFYAPVSSLAKIAGGNVSWQKGLPGVNITNVPQGLPNGTINVGGDVISQYPVKLNGTLYAPINSLASTYDIPYQWNAGSNSLTIGAGQNGVPLTELMQPYQYTGFMRDQEIKYWPTVNSTANYQLKMGGQPYTYGVQFDAGAGTGVGATGTTGLGKTSLTKRCILTLTRSSPACPGWSVLTISPTL